MLKILHKLQKDDPEVLFTAVTSVVVACFSAAAYFFGVATAFPATAANFSAAAFSSLSFTAAALSAARLSLLASPVLAGAGFPQAQASPAHSSNALSIHSGSTVIYTK